ncbi:hypothetical protein AVEN_17600-1 [Araneus ventricosus]|uniref:Secreted protein n=1 Tax=Araneus ventricosus TaxID=182803 RepID=A0A4Y2HWH4_ARAVE|nr:hypothetical protein AVEN_17600-1 [Araneus ventricosus]
MYNFYRRFISKAAHILALLIKCVEGHTNRKKPSCRSKNSENSLERTEEAENSFTAAERALVDATLFKHPIPGAINAPNAWCLDRCVKFRHWQLFDATF